MTIPKGTPKRLPSGVRRIDPLLPRDNRLAALRRNPGRWPPAAVGAALALPTAPDLTIDEWERVFDRLDMAIKLAILPFE
jgi:hypothetical protein